jgi:hypothetical protein
MQFIAYFVLRGTGQFSVGIRIFQTLSKVTIHYTPKTLIDRSIIDNQKLH